MSMGGPGQRRLGSSVTGLLAVMLALTLVLALVLTPARGRAETAVVCNPNGAVVTLEDGRVIYLGKSCDAAQRGGGSGHWWLAASAFVVDIDGQAMRLPVELGCALPACRAP